MRSMIVSLATATAWKTVGVTVEKGTERLDVYVSADLRRAPIAFLREHGGRNDNHVSHDEVRDILRFHANLTRSQKKGRK